MKQDVKEKWVAALRSGEYQQTQSELKDLRGGFCCLGVLCDLYLNEKGLKWEHDREGHNVVDGEYGLLPPSVSEWAGLDNNPQVLYATKSEREQWWSLSTINDVFDGEFPLIADLIEAQL